MTVSMQLPFPLLEMFIPVHRVFWLVNSERFLTEIRSETGSLFTFDESLLFICLVKGDVDFFMMWLGDIALEVRLAGIIQVIWLADTDQIIWLANIIQVLLLAKSLDNTIMAVQLSFCIPILTFGSSILQLDTIIRARSFVALFI